MSNERPWEDEEEIILSGANKDLMEWVEQSPIGQKYVIGPVGKDNLCKAIGLSHHWGVASLYAYQAIITLWKRELGFGPYPLDPENLADLEYKGKFFQDYREHTVHQLRVFLLGLLLYDTSKLIKEKLHKDILGDNITPEDLETEAIRRWKATALAHDVGYALESEEIDPSYKIENNKERYTEDKECVRNWLWLEKKFNESLAYPLSKQEVFNRYNEAYYTRKKRLYSAVITTPGQLEEILKDVPDCGKYVQIYTERAGIGSGKADGMGLIQYYQLCRANQSAQGRPFFRDHGIVGALLLLNTAHEFYQHAQGLKELGKEVLAHFWEKVNNAANEAERILNNRTIWAAAAAISLHNVNLKAYSRETCLDSGLNPDRYRLSLTKTPLAFLLGLADTLQDWDRQLFRAPRASDKKILAGIDIRLHLNVDNLGLSWKSDGNLKNGGTNPNGNFQIMRNRMREYLEWEDIDKLIEWTPQLNDKREEDIYRLNLGALASQVRKDRNLLAQQRRETIRKEYRGDDSSPYVIDNVFQLTSEKTEAITRLLAKTITPNSEKATDLLSLPLNIENCYINPLRLVTGLITTLDENWPDLVYAYSKMVKKDKNLQAFHYFISFCWLAWGPSIDMRSFCKDINNRMVVVQVSFGDEANSLPLIVERNMWKKHFESALETANRKERSDWNGVAFRLTNIHVVNPSVDSKFFSALMNHELVQGIFKNNVALYFGNDSGISAIQEKDSAGCYSTAYVWLMLEQVEKWSQGTVPEKPKLFEPGKVIPFFEHANLACGETLKFLQHCLVRKALHHILECVNHEPYKETGYYRYATALFDDEIAGKDVLDANVSNNNQSIFQEEFSKLIESDQDKICDRLWVPPSSDRRNMKDVLDFVQAFQKKVKDAVEA